MSPMPQRLGWVTDPHLNFVDLQQWDAFAEHVHESKVDAWLISGDVSEAEDVIWQLRRIASEFDKPIFFVLGNHDFYHGSTAEVRVAATRAVDVDSRLRYLTGTEPVALGHEWILCGEDGWADGRVGNYDRSPVQMNDFRWIHDLMGLDARSRLRWLKREGACAAIRLRNQLRAAAAKAKRILVLTHVPPFRESCWYAGRHCDDDWAPYFVCHATGRMLRQFCASHPRHEVLVLCGHTHHAGCSQILDNLTVWTGAAEYGRPRVAEVIDLPRFSYRPVDWTYAGQDEHQAVLHDQTGAS